MPMAKPVILMVEKPLLRTRLRYAVLKKFLIIRLYKKDEIPPAEYYQKRQAPAQVKTGKKNQCCMLYTHE